MGYSRTAQVIYDYALTEAKRTESSKVNCVHLLGAIRNWHANVFDERFPGMWVVVQFALSSIPNDGARPDGADVEADRILSAITSDGEAWTAAEELLQRPEIVSASDGLARKGLGTKIDASSPSEPDETSASDVHVAGIGLTTAFEAEIASVLGCEPAEIETALAGDAMHVAASIIGSGPESLSGELASVIDQPVPTTAPLKRSDLIPRLVARGTSESGRSARRLASSLVAVATWAASLDDEVTQEETNRIDDLRLELRQELDSSSAPTPGAASRFDEVFGRVIGLESVKRELRQRIDYFNVLKQRRARGLPTSEHLMHMAFLGNPGTGKTTVARLFAEVLREMDLLSTGQLVEVDRSGLIGEFVGKTEMKTNEVVDTALGGVLFIDEAYALVDGYSSTKGYGQEAIDVLIKRMEDDRNNLIVIAAGYSEPMKEFLSSNPGLKSRIPSIIAFPDYSTEELVQVADSMAQADGFKLDDDSHEKFRRAADAMRLSDNFGNARDIRNIYEMTVRNQFSRVARLGDLATNSELTTLTGDDVPNVDPPKPKNKTIGFR